MTEKQISAVQTVPLKYSLDLESQLKQAVVKRDRLPMIAYWSRSWHTV